MSPTKRDAYKNQSTVCVFSRSKHEWIFLGWISWFGFICVLELVPLWRLTASFAFSNLISHSYFLAKSNYCNARLSELFADEVTIRALMRPNSCCCCDRIKGNCHMYNPKWLHCSEIAYQIHLFQFNHFAERMKSVFERCWCSDSGSHTGYMPSRWIERQIGLSQQNRRALVPISMSIVCWKQLNQILKQFRLITNSFSRTIPFIASIQLQ